MVEDPLSSAQLGLVPEELVQHEPPISSVETVPTLEIYIPPLEFESEMPLPASTELSMKPDSIFSRSYDAMIHLAQTGQLVTPKNIAAIALAKEIAAGLSIEDAEFKVANNIYAQRKSFLERSGIEIATSSSKEHGLEFKPHRNSGPTSFRSRKTTPEEGKDLYTDLPAEPIRQRLSILEIDTYSHPEKFGDEGSALRILAEIMFSRALSNRSSSRELIFEEFAPIFLLSHPGSAQKTVENAFRNGLALLDRGLKGVSSSFEIPRPTGNNRNSILKIEHSPIPTPVTPQREAILQNDTASTTPTSSVNEKTETEDEKQDAIDTSVFGLSKTTLIQYLLSSNKTRTLTDISIIRRKDGKMGPVLTAEMNTTRMVISTLQLELPKGVELRNPHDQNNNPIADQFEISPNDITVQQIIEVKKQEIEAARIAKIEEQNRQESERSAREAEQQAQRERMRAEAERARAEVERVRAEKIEAERMAAEERAREQELANSVELALSTTFDLLENTKPKPQTLQTQEPEREPKSEPEPKTERKQDEEPTQMQRSFPARRFQMQPGIPQDLAPKKAESPKETEITVRDGKVEMSMPYFDTLMTLVGLERQIGVTPRELTSTKLNGKFKSHDAAITERHLEELKQAFADTPIKISHPVNEDGIVENRRFIITIPEGISIRNFISFK